MDLGAAVSVSPALLTASPQMTAEEMARRGNIRATAEKFESSFLSVMLQQMLAGVDTASGPFGGGAGEDMFKSFMAEAMADQMSRAGGVGVADNVMKEMLKMQGLK